MPQHPENYFDYEKYGREMSWDGPMDNSFRGSIYAEFGVEEDDDAALGEEIINQMYGDVRNLDNRTLMNYIDVKALARGLESDFTYIDYDGGMIELF